MSNPTIKQSSIARPLAWLLGLGNARARGSSLDREFYALKDRLLRKYGTRDGVDIQHIKRECWGYEEDGKCLGKGCRRCGGSGVWDEKWIELERWAIGGRVFHRPSGFRYSAPSADDLFAPRNVIEGLITHYDVSYRASSEARLWLFLLFDRRAWRHEIGRSRACGWQWRPMLALQAIVFEIRMALALPWNRRCLCGRRIIRPFSRQYHFACRRCDVRRAAFVGSLDDNLPF